MSEKDRERIMEINDDYAKNGLGVLAVASHVISDDDVAKGPDRAEVNKK